ncbi:MAG: MerR family DNA-binding transcriptional regulator [Sciscionella sp.]
MSELLPTAVAAKALGISSRTLARYAERGLLRPAVVLPTGHYRWDLDDVRRQLDDVRRDREP